MEINRKTVEDIAHLARLALNDEEKNAMVAHLSKIVGWMDKLNEVSTENIVPLINMSDNTNIMRNDEVKEHLPHQEALKNAPKKDSDYIRVPKVLE